MIAEHLPPMLTVELDPAAAFHALTEIETARDYWTRRVGLLTRIRGPLDQDTSEVQLAAKIAKLTDAAKALRDALYGGPDLTDGEHFAGMPPRAPGINRLRVVGDEPLEPPHEARLHPDGVQPQTYIAGCGACDFAYVRQFGEFSRSGA